MLEVLDKMVEFGGKVNDVLEKIVFWGNMLVDGGVRHR